MGTGVGGRTIWLLEAQKRSGEAVVDNSRVGGWAVNDVVDRDGIRIGRFCRHRFWEAVFAGWKNPWSRRYGVGHRDVYGNEYSSVPGCDGKRIVRSYRPWCQQAVFARQESQWSWDDMRLVTGVYGDE